MLFSIIDWVVFKYFSPIYSNLIVIWKNLITCITLSKTHILFFFATQNYNYSQPSTFDPINMPHTVYGSPR